MRDKRYADPRPNLRVGSARAEEVRREADAYDNHRECECPFQSGADSSSAEGVLQEARAGGDSAEERLSPPRWRGELRLICLRLTSEPLAFQVDRLSTTASIARS
jgi:hypothetical protein